MKKINANEFDKKFDANENVSDFIDWENATLLDNSSMRVSVDFPKWMVHSLDREAKHLGLSRQAIIKLSVADHLKQSV